MAKLYQKGDCYRLYVNNGTYLTPVWSFVPQADALSVDPQKTDVSIPAYGVETGHLHGKGDPLLTFVLMEDAGSQDVDNLIVASLNGNQAHIAIARDDLTLPGVVFWHLEAVLFSSLTANQGQVASYDMEARRHSAGNGLTREQTPPAAP